MIFQTLKPRVIMSMIFELYLVLGKYSVSINKKPSVCVCVSGDKHQVTDGNIGLQTESDRTKCPSVTRCSDRTKCLSVTRCSDGTKCLSVTINHKRSSSLGEAWTSKPYKA